MTSALAASSALNAESKAAVHEVLGEGGPLAQNSVPATSPPGAARAYALDALGHGYAIGFVVCGSAALFSALLVVTALRGRTAQDDTAQPEDAAGRTSLTTG
ncbi:hypothetical protein [Streptomyces sp. MMG1121]|uniref:hypothetical protein n=1 Tax=Streptomyces sp. MMG1121 TaxID=1415544 RepID=UPI0006B05403|nr:hypothetical protein [Streptomyces sp. MMG1121]KOV67505.1 hypothetical protein ADK64_09120 [Streptomyces sp. MMG1121]